MTRYVHVWDDNEQLAREWLAGAGATLSNDAEGWEFTDEERAEVLRLLAQRQAGKSKRRRSSTRPRRPRRRPGR
jgi:hypothetical protein